MKFLRSSGVKAVEKADTLSPYGQHLVYFTRQQIISYQRGSTFNPNGPGKKQNITSRDNKLGKLILALKLLPLKVPTP